MSIDSCTAMMMIFVSRRIIAEMSAATEAANRLSLAMTDAGMSFSEMRHVFVGLNVLYPHGRGIVRRCKLKGDKQ